MRLPLICAPTLEKTGRVGAWNMAAFEPAKAPPLYERDGHESTAAAGRFDMVARFRASAAIIGTWRALARATPPPYAVGEHIGFPNPNSRQQLTGRGEANLLR